MSSRIGAGFPCAVLVLGSGVIGTCCAYYLARAGHEVTVIDRQPGAGLETSYANAGEVSPGYSSPWAGPGVPVKAIKWLLMQHSPLVIRALLQPSMWRFALMMLANCTERRYRINKSRMVPIAEYSRDCLRALRADTGIAYDDRAQGTLQLFRTQQQLDGVASDIAILREYGVPFELLDRDGFVRVEPALARTREKFVGALRLPNDETGDCHLFTQRLAALAATLGVQFRYGTSISALTRADGRVSGVLTEAGRLEADHYVCSLGSYTPLLLAPLGIDLPVHPVKGYSITVTVPPGPRCPPARSPIPPQGRVRAADRWRAPPRARGGVRRTGGARPQHRPRRGGIIHDQDLQRLLAAIPHARTLRKIVGFTCCSPSWRTTMLSACPTRSHPPGRRCVANRWTTRSLSAGSK